MTRSMKAILWAGAIGLVVFGGTTGVLDPGAFVALVIVLPIFAALSILGPWAAKACASPDASAANLRYGRRILLAGLAYAIGLVAAITLDQRLHLTGTTAFLIALLPVMPIFGMIWAMGAYIVEEQDEYLRHRATLSALVGLALVLGLGSFWGFLDDFGVVPHAPGWWAMPVWAIGMGFGRMGLAWRDRMDKGE